jgi:predicted ATP-dependent serine protease
MKQYVPAIQNDRDREHYAKLYEMECPPHDPLMRQRLMEQIRSCKSAYMERDALRQALAPLKFSDGSARKLCDIDIVEMKRFSTGIRDIDRLLGTDEKTGVDGMPYATCLLLAAQRGCGKTRLAVDVCAFVGDPNDLPDDYGNSGVFYIQNEECLSRFRTRAAKHWPKDLKVTLSDSTDLIQTCYQINEAKPRLVVVDSLQGLSQAQIPGGLTNIVAQYKSIAETTGTSFWLISQLNTKGGVKGGTNPGHKVDIELFAEKPKGSSGFVVSCPQKNRYGETGFGVRFAHGADGVISQGMFKLGEDEGA